MNIRPVFSEEGSSRRAAPGDSPRPSLARTTFSTQASPRSRPSSREGWQSNDIRGDLASGWGDGERSGNRGGAAAARGRAGSNNDNPDDDWGWRLCSKAVRPVPPFYPIDPRSTRCIVLSSTQPGGNGGDEKMKILEDETRPSIKDVSRQISRACQSLSIHAIWDNNSPMASLSSMERVEMEITFYFNATASTPPSQQSPPHILLVELQRRKGCAVTFHNYRRCLLDAAEGKFDPASFHKTDGLDKARGRERNNLPRATLGRPGLARPSLSRAGSSGPPSSLTKLNLARPTQFPTASPPDLSHTGRPSVLVRTSPFLSGSMDPPSPGMIPGLRSPSLSVDDAAPPIAGLKTEGESSPKTEVDVHNDIVEKALKALNMAALLIKKDRVDARTLGMESLVLLTDPLRAGMETANIASRVVLFGSANEDDVRLEDGENDIDALFDESAGLGIRETILEMIMTDDSAEKMASEEDTLEGIEKEFTDSLFNLCLTVLSNALHTIEESVKLGVVPSGSNAPSPNNRSDHNDMPGSHRRRAVTEPAVLPSGVPKRFIEDTNSAFGVDVLSSLIHILGQAKKKPHDAYHSARCLGVLFKGCGNSHKARAQRDLDAKRIIAAALEVGSRSHAKLEDASRVAMMALVTDDEESVEEGGEENTGMENERREEQMEGPQLHDPPFSMEQSMSAESEER